MKYLYLTRRHCPTITRVEATDIAPNYVRVRVGRGTRREVWRTPYHEYHTDYAEAKRVLLFDLAAKYTALQKETDAVRLQWWALNTHKETDFDK